MEMRWPIFGVVSLISTCLVCYSQNAHNTKTVFDVKFELFTGWLSTSLLSHVLEFLVDLETDGVSQFFKTFADAVHDCHAEKCPDCECMSREVFNSVVQAKSLFSSEATRSFMNFVIANRYYSPRIEMFRRLEQDHLRELVGRVPSQINKCMREKHLSALTKLDSLACVHTKDLEGPWVAVIPPPQCGAAFAVCDLSRLSAAIDHVSPMCRQDVSEDAGCESNGWKFSPVPLFEHFIRSSPGHNAYIVLYGNLDDPKVADAYKLVLSDSFGGEDVKWNVIFRHGHGRLTLHTNGESSALNVSEQLTGFSAELAIKNSEYATVDEPVDYQQPEEKEKKFDGNLKSILKEGINEPTERKDEEEADDNEELENHTEDDITSADDILTANELKDIGLQMATHFFRARKLSPQDSSQDFATLLETTLNFPAKVNRLAKVRVSETIRKSVTRLRKTFRDHTLLASLNGRNVKVADMTLHSVIKRLGPLYAVNELFMRLSLTVEETQLIFEKARPVLKNETDSFANEEHSSFNFPARLDWRPNECVQDPKDQDGYVRCISGLLASVPLYDVMSHPKTDHWSDTLSFHSYMLFTQPLQLKLPMNNVVITADILNKHHLDVILFFAAMNALPMRLSVYFDTSAASDHDTSREFAAARRKAVNYYGALLIPSSPKSKGCVWRAVTEKSRAKAMQYLAELSESIDAIISKGKRYLTGKELELMVDAAYSQMGVSATPLCSFNDPLFDDASGHELYLETKALSVPMVLLNGKVIYEESACALENSGEAFHDWMRSGRTADKCGAVGPIPGETVGRKLQMGFLMEQHLLGNAVMTGLDIIDDFRVVKKDLTPTYRDVVTSTGVSKNIQISGFGFWGAHSPTPTLFLKGLLQVENTLAFGALLPVYWPGAIHGSSERTSLFTDINSDEHSQQGGASELEHVRASYMDSVIGNTGGERNGFVDYEKLSRLLTFSADTHPDYDGDIPDVCALVAPVSVSGLVAVESTLGSFTQRRMSSNVTRSIAISLIVPEPISNSEISGFNAVLHTAIQLLIKPADHILEACNDAEAKDGLQRLTWTLLRRVVSDLRQSSSPWTATLVWDTFNRAVDVAFTSAGLQCASALKEALSKLTGDLAVGRENKKLAALVGRVRETQATVFPLIVGSLNYLSVRNLGVSVLAINGMRVVIDKMRLMSAPQLQMLSAASLRNVLVGDSMLKYSRMDPKVGTFDIENSLRTLLQRMSVYKSATLISLVNLLHDLSSAPGEDIDLAALTFSRTPEELRIVLSSNDSTNAAADSSLSAAVPLLAFTVFIDPLTSTGQKTLSIAQALHCGLGIPVHLAVFPKAHYSEYPLDKWYRLAAAMPSWSPLLGNRAVCSSNSTDSLRPSTTFSSLNTSHTLTTSMQAHHTWQMSPVESVFDLDNLRRADVHSHYESLSGDKGGHRLAYGSFRLSHLYLECFSHTVDKLQHSTVDRHTDLSGLEFRLTTINKHGTAPDNRGSSTDRRQESMYEFEEVGTLAMGNLGYVQLPAPPGIYKLDVMGNTRLPDLKYSFLSPVDKSNALQSVCVVLASFAPSPRVLRLVTKSQTAADNSLSEISFCGRVRNLVSSILPSAMWRPPNLTRDPKVMDDSEVVRTHRHSTRSPDTVHIFSLASGHMYERLLLIMMLSVRKHTQAPLHFWILENFLSPKLMRVLSEFAAEHNFTFSSVTYKWPSWLYPQTVKQRIIWAYKILFLDVLFPLNLERVLYIDADQVVRADVQTLFTSNMNGAVYAYVPFCNSNPLTKEFRFWETGYWEQHLRGKPYHISALYLVDLDALRRSGANNRLRYIYNLLSRDKNSLANLDQDLPNYAQHDVPIFSLPQEWLWCETWCSLESKSSAKTIDLCNNPLTKEPKLSAATRIIPEWSAYASVVREFYDGQGVVKASTKTHTTKPNTEL